MRWLLSLFLLLPFTILRAQERSKPGREATDSLPQRLEEVVVTATRTEKHLVDVPLPVSVITSKQINNAGMIRLNEILAEQTGLALVSDHGTGIQMQGFDPDYTLILMDGQPLIGRTTGTFELSRIAAGNIDRIEIVKGPSSSLYGSEALAGVINIITKMPRKGFSATFSGRYGSKETADLGASFNYRNDKLGLYGFVNRYGSGGYHLAKGSPGPTVPPFYGHTLQLKSDYSISEQTTLKLSGRYFDENQENYYLIEEEGSPKTVDEKGLGSDFNFSTSLRHRFSDKIQAVARLYYSGYKTSSTIVYRENREPYDNSFFDQRFFRPEIQAVYAFAKNVKFNGGLGWAKESVRASRYTEKQNFHSGYIYLQAEWDPSEQLNLILGGRFDQHSQYNAQLSPRISGQYRFSPRLSVYASLGRGYKAPDFRQLYLNFTNPVAGYSVFGINELKTRLQELDKSGLIRTYLIDPSTINVIDAESSLSYNAGIRYAPFPQLEMTANVFRNDVKNMIASSAVAVKTNGQSVFSYFNLNKVFTRGLEFNADYDLLRNLHLGAGYQFLQAFDKDVLGRLEAGEIFRRSPRTGKTERVPKKDYAGLSNRSKHMGKLALSYDNFRYGFNISLRAIHRGRYGFGDFNGNGIVDTGQEYVKGYNLLNLAVSKRLLGNKLLFQLEAENLLDYTDAAHIPTLPGRLFYAGLNFNIGKNK